MSSCLSINFQTIANYFSSGIVFSLSIYFHYPLLGFSSNFVGSNSNIRRRRSSYRFYINIKSFHLHIKITLCIFGCRCTKLSEISTQRIHSDWIQIWNVSVKNGLWNLDKVKIFYNAKSVRSEKRSVNAWTQWILFVVLEERNRPNYADCQSSFTVCGIVEYWIKLTNFYGKKFAI